MTTWSWGTPGNAGPDLDIGPTSDRTGVFLDDWNQPGASVFLDGNGNWDVTIADRRQVFVGCVQ